jgi:hypothetical protein
MTRKPFLEAGTRIINPGNYDQGYRLTVDVFSGDIVKAEQFEAFGGAPEALPDHPVPEWVAAVIYPERIFA